MKRRDLISFLIEQGCVFAKEGTKHSLFFNPETQKFSTVPRHNEVDSFLAKKICKDLGIKKIQKR